MLLSMGRVLRGGAGDAKGGYGWMEEKIRHSGLPSLFAEGVPASLFRVASMEAIAAS